MANNIVSRSGWFTPMERIFRIQWTRGSQARYVHGEAEPPPQINTLEGESAPTVICGSCVPFNIHSFATRVSQLKIWHF